MNNTRLSELLTKFRENSCSDAELAELEQWYIALQTGDAIIDEIQAGAFSDDMLSQFREKIAPQIPVIPFYRRLYFKIAAAASIVLFLGLGLYLQSGKDSNRTIAVIPYPQIRNDVQAPKASKAMITLANGQTVLLDSINSGTLVKEGNVHVEKTSDGQIVYTGAATEVVYNTLNNPRGSKVVSITLSDGTTVWLNCESSLRYPVSFIGKERNVEITGEAYFEVAKNASKKFVVNSNGIQTEVLGTHFNVNTYANESNVKITLLEGAVKVTKGALSNLLKPGQQAQVSAQIKLVDGIDTEVVMAWKNGLFHFDNTNIQDLLKQLARWYDIEIVYKNTIPDRAFGGEISREANLSQVVKILTESNLKCRLEGNRLIVE